MYKVAPHVIPYQGSKRKLAPQILPFMPETTRAVFEPFAGSAAITLAAAQNGIGKKFVVSDKFEPLMDLWRMIVEEPQALVEAYSSIWNEQLTDPSAHYLSMRQYFNKHRTPPHLLYLVARCVKNAVRFNSSGEFNQGADNRRLGMKPEKLMREINAVSKLLRGRVEFQSGDFRDVLKNASEEDLVYMDPPWQGTSGKKDPRYAYLLNLDELIAELALLNERRVPFILSFDGSCGDRSYGAELPSMLKMERVLLSAGRSSQSTLLGRNEETIESLYLSPSLVDKLGDQLPGKIDEGVELTLF